MQTKQEVYDFILGQYSAALQIPTSALGETVKVDAATQATIYYNCLLRIEKVKSNIWVGTCDYEQLLIFGYGRLKRYPYPAVAGVYLCQTTQITGQTDLLEKGSEFKSGSYSFTTTADCQAGAQVSVIATTAGTASSLNVGDTLTSVVALPSISDTIVVLSETTAPTDSESTEDYRQDVLDSYLINPSGGSAGDYILWAEDAEGCRTVYPYAKPNEVGKVLIYVEASSTIIPSSGVIDNVIDAVRYDEDGQGRVAAHLFPFITTTNVISVQNTIVNIFIGGASESQRTLMETLIEGYLLNIRPYLESLNDTRDEDADTIKQSSLISLLSNNGVVFTTLQIFVIPAPTSTSIEVTEYRVGFGQGSTVDSDYYGEVPILDTLVLI